jgi:hypothetical protein
MLTAAEQNKILLQISNAILVAVAGSGDGGTPGGVLYAALMTHGATLEQYEGIMGGLVQAGLLTKSGQCYHVTAAGKRALAK